MPCLCYRTQRVIAPHRWALLHVRVELSPFEVTMIGVVQARIHNKLWPREENHHIPASKFRENRLKSFETKRRDSKNGGLGQIALSADGLQFVHETRQHEA
jgi:hypothetical protein